MEKYTITEPFLDAKCGLGEGPFWEEDRNLLRFVDIVKQHVWYVDLNVGSSSAKKQEYEMSISLTANHASSNDVFVFGGKHGVGVAQKNSGEYHYIQRWWTPEEEAQGKTAQFRANDGAVDSRGRLWAGTMNDPLTASIGRNGVLFRLDLDGSFHRVIENVAIPNGLTWSRDDKTMYFTASEEQTIFAYDFDAETGAISNKRPFFKPETATPDGHAQDVDGNLWVALWGGSKVVRVSPEGKVTAEIAVPTRCPTAIVFAGEDLYITSAEDPEADTKHPESKKYQGGLFKCHVGIRGRRPFVAKIPL